MYFLPSVCRKPVLALRRWIFLWCHWLKRSRHWLKRPRHWIKRPRHWIKRPRSRMPAISFALQMPVIPFALQKLRSAFLFLTVPSSELRLVLMRSGRCLMGGYLMGGFRR